MINQYNTKKAPIPVKIHNCRHPDLFESCNLLAPAEKVGIVRPQENIKVYGPSKKYQSNGPFKVHS